MNTCGQGYCCTKIDNLTVTKGSDTILSKVNFHIHCGEITSIIGRNGAGKTTLIRALLGEIKYSGKISFHHHTGAQKSLKIGYVPQKLNLDNSPSSVYDIFASFISDKPVFLFKSKKLYAQIQMQLAEFGAELLIDKRISELSGGELQRVMLSLAMIPLPDILLLDEPVSGMDRDGLDMFYKKLIDLKSKNDIAILMVSHDFDYVSRYSDRVILLNKTVLEDNTPDILLSGNNFKREFRIDFGGKR